MTPVPKLRLLFVFVVSATLFHHGCARSQGSGPQSNATKQGAVKNTILLIGDGMGFGAIGLLELYARHQQGGRSALLDLVRQSEVGFALTSPQSYLVTDSACSATELASGIPGTPESVGLSASGKPVETVLEKARKSGKWAGLVSDTRITHATPAAFAAHRQHRSDENGIAEDLIHSHTEVLFSGGLRHFLPASVNTNKAARTERAERLFGTDHPLSSKRPDERDLLQEAESLGYRLAFTNKQLESVSKVPALGLFAGSGMNDAFESFAEAENSNRLEPTLAEMTQKALSLLSESPNGFFLMVEGGQIDWAAHENDAGLMLKEMLKFDDAIRAVLEWAAGRDDTLVVLTADHETGSFGLSYSAHGLKERYELEAAEQRDGTVPLRFNFLSPEITANLAGQKKSFLKIGKEFSALPPQSRTPDQLATMIRDATGFTITRDEAWRILLEGPNRFYIAGHDELGETHGPLVEPGAAYYPDIHENITVLISRALSEQQGVVWGTGTHTADPVLVAAYGPEAARKKFNGMLSHPDVGQLLIQSLGLD